ncbi:MAG TPA: carotenoid biosynthesis protein [Bdellovibrionota bacterium]|nr:carotenoid biosynthesis protein [Bdellovibrionota bacterium]
MHVLILFFKTVALRPYVFTFLAAFLLTGIISMGLWRTFTFFGVVWAIAFLSEISSTRTGFPYGLYHYTGITRGQELYIGNVPFMDSLSYTFLLFASFSLALFSLAPLRIQKGDVQVADTFRIRWSWSVLFLTSVYMMMIDFVIDPAALRGERWFLGKIYYYEYEGHYFGVPLSNALGWGLIGLVAMFLYQRIEKRWFGPGFRDRGIRVWPLRGLFGVGLYYGVLAFILTVTWWIGEYGLFIAGCFIYVIPATSLILKLVDRRARGTEAEWQNHLHDFQVVLR